jgi:hypothetical protein
MHAVYIMKHSEPFSLLGEDLRHFTPANFLNWKILREEERVTARTGQRNLSNPPNFPWERGCNGKGETRPTWFHQEFEGMQEEMEKQGFSR